MPDKLSKPLRVLIIDDHSSFRSVARELLERRGFVVVAEADCATAGLQAAERFGPEAVLLDVGLPDGDGFDVCHALTRRNPELAVILVSADEPYCGPDRARECAARGFLPKSRLGSSNLVAFFAG